MHEELISISILTRQENIIIIIKLDFVWWLNLFSTEFLIKKFFKGCSSGLKKTVVKYTVCRNILRITNFENVDKTLFVYFISL
jgi:hypothetical protein